MNLDSFCFTMLGCNVSIQNLDSGAASKRRQAREVDIMQLISRSLAVCQHARGDSHIAAQLSLRDAALASAASLLVALEFPLQELLVLSYLILQ